MVLALNRLFFFASICCVSFQTTLDYCNDCGILQHMRFRSDMHKHGMCTSIVNLTGDWHSSYLIWNSCIELRRFAPISREMQPFQSNESQWIGRTCESELNRLIQCVDMKLNVNFHIGTLPSHLQFFMRIFFFWLWYQHVESITKAQISYSIKNHSTRSVHTIFSRCALTIFMFLLLFIVFITWDNFQKKKNATLFHHNLKLQMFCVSVFAVRLVFRFIWSVCICKNCVKICDFNFMFSLFPLLLFRLNWKWFFNSR